MLYGYLNSPFVSNPFSDAAIPPTSLTSPVVSGSGVVGQTLSTTDGTWSGTLPITFAYQWNRNGSIIVGATNNTYTLVTADASNSITCTVTATNAGGFASSTSNAISVAAAGDADANAFIAAAAITDTTQKSAIDKLVVDLKGYGIWTKMKALYPFVGGTAAQHKFNLKNPLDSDAAFRLVFNGGWTHSSTGALPNGTNAYANSFLILANELGTDRPHISYYSRTNANTATDQIDMGVFNDSAYCWISAWYNGSGFSNVLARNTSPSVLLNGGTTTDSRGLYQTNKILTVSKLQKNSSILDTKTDTTGNVTGAPIYIGAINNFGSAFNFTNRQTAFNAIGSGLTDTEASNFSVAVNNFQVTLGRNV